MKSLRKSRWRRGTVVIAGLAVIAAIVVAVRELAPAGREATTHPHAVAIPVTTAVAIRQDVPEIIDTIGTVQSIDAVAIQAQVSGPIVKIEFAPGQNVKKGQELFLIDPRPYQAALDQAKAQLAHDEAVLAEAEIDLARYQTLAKQNSIAAQTAQDQVYVVQQDKGTVGVDQAKVDTAAINLDYCHIKAPVSGRAGVLLVDLGNVVGPTTIGSQPTNSSTATPSAVTSATTGTGTGTSSGLVSISQMQPIYVSFPISQTDLDTVKTAHAKAALDVDAFSQAGKPIDKGKLTVIDNQVNSGTGTVTMQATFANTDAALWPGEFVRVQLVVGMRRDVVTVPAAAVMMGPDGSYAYLISADRTAQRVDVQVAARRHGIDVIEKGVSAGETVVTDGQYRLSDGAKVAVRQTAATAATRP